MPSLMAWLCFEAVALYSARESEPDDNHPIIQLDYRTWR